MNSYGVVMNDETPTQTADVNNTPNQVPTMSSTGAIPKRRHIKLDVNKEGKIRSCGEGKDNESSSHTHKTDRKMATDLPKQRIPRYCVTILNTTYQEIFNIRPFLI